MQEINVLYPFDNNYAPYAGISLTSLLENNHDADRIRIFVLGFDLDSDMVMKFEQTVLNYGRELIWLASESIDKMIQEFDMPSYRGARVATARLFVSYYMPKDVDRLLYLDSDTIIVGSLEGLMREDLCGMPVGMVCDSVARDYKKYMGFAPDECYFNGGMILYDLKKWRALRCTERIVEHIRKVRCNYEALDQDLINITLKNEITRLDPRYNFQPFHCVYTPRDYIRSYGMRGYYDEETIRNAEKNIIILHTFRYQGMFPWDQGSVHPCVEQFIQYKRISVWNKMKPNPQLKPGLIMKIERLLSRVLPRIVYLRLFRKVFEIHMRKIEKDLKGDHAYRNA